jgi:hypothetical protein
VTWFETVILDLRLCSDVYIDIEVVPAVLIAKSNSAEGSLILMFAIRREIIDYGAIPLSSWLPQGDSPAVIQVLLRHLISVATEDGTHRKISFKFFTLCKVAAHSARFALAPATHAHVSSIDIAPISYWCAQYTTPGPNTLPLK